MAGNKCIATMRKALEFYELAGKQGNTDEYRQIGIHHFCLHVKEDIQKTKEYLNKAIELGDMDSLYELGRLYEEKVEKAKILTGKEEIDKIMSLYANDFAKAKECYEKAAEFGCFHAIHDLIKLYANDKGVEKDDAVILKYIIKAVELDDIYALCKLGGYYEMVRKLSTI